MDITEYIPQMLPPIDIAEYDKLDVICDTSTLSNDAWLNIRKNTIGASYAGVIRGQSKYKTPRKLYEEFRAATVEPLDVQNTSMSLLHGHVNEALAAECFRRKTKYELHEEPRMFRCTIPGYEMIACTPDYICRLPMDCEYGSAGEICLVECKCPAGEPWLIEEAWGTDDNPTVPPEYWTQAQQQMAVMKLNVTFFAVKYGARETDFLWRVVFRNEAEIAEILEEGKQFYLSCKSGTPPVSAFAGQGKLMLEELSELFAEDLMAVKDEPKTIQFPDNLCDELDTVLSELDVAKAQVEILEDRKNMIQSIIFQQAIDQQWAKTTLVDSAGNPRYKFTISTRAGRRSCDIDALEMLIPSELFNELVTTSAPSASTRLTKVKPKKAKAKK